MESQSESDKKPGTDQVNDSAEKSKDGVSRGVDVAIEGQQFEPFTDADPFRAARTAEAVGETRTFLSEIQIEPAGFSDATPEQQRRVHADAAERASWSQARQDEFLGILRLGRRTPPRSKRVL